MRKAKNTAAPAGTSNAAALDAFKGEPGTYQVIDMDLIRESPFNPRKSYNQAALDELAENIKEMGVIQPIRVRPQMINVTDSPEDGQIEGFEVIFGHRRFRAARIARERTIPAMVSVLTDAQSARLQAVENLQREDLDPIEEAEGYGDYIRDHGVTKDELAAHISKSRTYVYNRLKLATLCEFGRQYVRNGALAPDLATEVARLPTGELQMQALHDLSLTNLQHADEPAEFMSYRDGQELLERKYKRHLDDAIFDRQVIFLVPDRTGCAECPDRAGNIPELEATGKRADMCTVPDCFNAKTKAHLAQIADEASKLGGRVIEADEAAKYFDSYGAKEWRTYGNNEILNLDQKHWRMDDRTPREALGKKLKPKDVVHVVNPYSGKVVQAVHIDTLIAYKVIEPENPDGDDDDDHDASGNGSGTPKLSAEEAEAKRAADFREKSIAEMVRSQSFDLTCELIKAMPRRAGDISAVLYTFFTVASNYEDGLMSFSDWVARHNEELAEQWEGYMYGEEGRKRDAATWAWINSLDGDYQGRLLLELALLLQPETHDPDSLQPDILMEVARSHGVDEAQLRDRAGVEFDARLNEVEQDEAAEA